MPINTFKKNSPGPAWKRIEAAVLDGRIPTGTPIKRAEICRIVGIHPGGYFSGYLMDLCTNKSSVRFTSLANHQYTARILTTP
jgi:hypothetical protein